MFDDFNDEDEDFMLFYLDGLLDDPDDKTKEKNKHSVSLRSSRKHSKLKKHFIFGKPFTKKQRNKK